MTFSRLKALAIGGVVLAAAALGGVVSTNAETAAFKSFKEMNAEERAAFRAEVEAYLLEEPEILRRALTILRERERLAALNVLKDLVKEGETVAIAGDPDGDVTIIELTDYNCPYCRRAQPEIAALLERDPKVRHVVKLLPYIGSDFPERVMVAAHKTGEAEKTLLLHRALMAHEGRLDDATVLRLAATAGFDAEALAGAARSPEIEAQLINTVRAARALELDGTPSFVIGVEASSGLKSTDELAALVAAARASR